LPAPFVLEPAIVIRAGTQGMPDFSHLGPDGEARMLDVSAKPVTSRSAAASARVSMRPEVLDALLSRRLKKGDALSTARIAGIQAAKRTSEWIPMCHALPLEHVQIAYARTGPGELLIACSARCTARTGVELEALVGASAAALTVYDMAKSADRAIEIGPVRLESKSGGRSGTFRRSDGPAPQG